MLLSPVSRQERAIRQDPVVKEIGGAAEPSCMDVDDQVAAAGGGRLGRLGARLPRPTGIRNGGLLLVLVGLAAVTALVDRPPDPVDGGRGRGIFQHLPPPVGITRLPPATPPGGGPLSALGGDGERAHPRRAHPRPARSESSGLLRGDVVSAPAGGGRAGPGSGGGPGGGSGGSRPPVVAPGMPGPPVAAVPATRVRVGPVTVRVTPPPVLGRDLPEVRAGTPEVRVETPAVEIRSLRLG
jgi:hypothetical protein